MNARAPSGDVVVIGAGVIGLALALELARRGATVRVFDSGHAAKAASWAAAGMLAPWSEEIADEAFLALCEQSLAAYPDWTAAVADAAGVDPRLRLDGIVEVAFSEEDLSEQRVRAQRLRARGVACSMLDRDAVFARCPALARTAVGGFRVEGEGHVDNRRLGRALAAACRARGVTLVEESGPVALEADARKVLGVRSALGFVPAGAVVNAAGAWAGQIEGVPPSCRPPVAPVKGQMLALQAPRGLVPHVTWVPGAYLVPRDDGRLLIGATVEDAGYDVRVTAGGVERLLNAVLRAVPALESCAVTETWAGLRPGTPDGLPYLGATPLAGYFLAAGHYRNGILLAPATARAVADAIEGKASSSLRDFSIGRTGATASMLGA